MKFIFAPDSFKGSLSSAQCIQILTQSARERFPGCETVGIPMADGGEGTIDAILSAREGIRLSKQVHGPLGQPVQASYGLLRDGMAIIEMSAASGLTLVPEGCANPMQASSYGTGELILDALERGANALSICVGGSATNDGGMGAMAALGARFYSRQGEELLPNGRNLENVYRIDLERFDPRIRQVKIRVLCDVMNPLCGKNGATYIFGPQKGGTEKQLDDLERGMRNYARVLEQATGISVIEMPGAGAAGGLSASLCALCGGSLVSGIDTVLSLVNFDHALAGADLVVTGEGCLDHQSENGKVVYGIGRRCQQYHVRAMAVVGSLKVERELVRRYGIEKVYPLMCGDVTLRQAMEQAEALFTDRADTLFDQLLAEQASWYSLQARVPG